MARHSSARCRTRSSAHSSEISAEVANGGVDGGEEVHFVVAVAVAGARGEHDDFGHTTSRLRISRSTTAGHCGCNTLIHRDVTDDARGHARALRFESVRPLQISDIARVAGSRGFREVFLPAQGADQRVRDRLGRSRLPFGYRFGARTPNEVVVFAECAGVRRGAAGCHHATRRASASTSLQTYSTYDGACGWRYRLSFALSLSPVPPANRRALRTGRRCGTRHAAFSAWTVGGRLAA